MRSQATSVLLLVATLAVGWSAAELDLADDYLPRADSLSLVDSPFLQETLAAMVKHPLPAGASASQMLATIKSSLDNTKDYAEMDFFEELYNLSLQDGKCTPNLRRYVLAIFTLAHETSEPAVQSYVAYMKSSIGVNKFAQCAQNTREEFERVVERFARRDEDALDRLFAAYSGGATASGKQDAELYRAAQSMDFAHGNFDVRQVLKVSKDIMPVGDRERARNSLDQVVGFVHTWCLKMQEPLKNVLAVFNVARALGSRLNVQAIPVKFLKLNEYNRVCLTLQKNRAQAEANIERQLKATKSWFKS